MQHVENMIGAVSTPCRSCFFVEVWGWRLS